MSRKENVMVRSRRCSKIYALMLMLVCIVSMCGVASAFTITGFSYESVYPNYRYRMDNSLQKTDPSPGYAYYGSGSALID